MVACSLAQQLFIFCFHRGDEQDWVCRTRIFKFYYVLSKAISVDESGKSEHLLGTVKAITEA